MNIDEMNTEVLECSRYGEEEDLTLLLQNGADVNFQDCAGNTGLHKAAANGHVLCLSTLKSFGAKYVANEQGNFPIHWAVQNQKIDAIKFLIANYEVDMLAQNSFGKSTLTEAFQTQNTDIIEICLTHPSASEEKLIEMNGTRGTVELDSSNGENNDERHAVLHKFEFEGDPAVVGKPLLIREMPISRADNPFGTDVAPEDDTTGLGLWPASLLAARWALRNWQLMENKVVAELGSGCGLPGLAVALRTKARAVYLTDIHIPTLNNALHNVQLNSTKLEAPITVFDSIPSGQKFVVSKEIANGDVAVGQESSGLSTTCDVEVLRVNWGDVSSYPSQHVDVLIGSDLVYDDAILKLLVPAVKGMLTEGGSFLYVAPESGRAGMDSFLDSMLNGIEGGVMELVEMCPCPDELFSNPLVSDDDASDLYVLHFYDLSIKKPHLLYHFRKKI